MIILGNVLKINTKVLCAIAYNGRQAVTQVEKSVQAFRGQKCGFDLILMDCNMPFMDGYDAAQEIREYLYQRKLRQPIIIATTGHTEPEYVNMAINAGMN